MIQITRNLARQVRGVVRRALNITPRGKSHPVMFQTGSQGLSILARSPDAVIEYRAGGEYPSEQIVVPFEALADCEGRKEEPVELEAQADGRILARWRDGGAPQCVAYDAAKLAEAADWPPLPDSLAENPAMLLKALAEAGETTDTDAVRFATNCVQLRGGTGTIAATDGRQMLIQSGFAFPWEGDILVPASQLFGCRDLPQDQPIRVARQEKWFSMQIGPWTAHLAINKDGRFPELSRYISPSAEATARCRLSAADAEFLVQTMPKLPSDEEFNFPITLDLNGHVAVRARAADQPHPTEVVLNASSWTGEPVRLNTNRTYLARAIKLGFRELCIFGPKVPVVCQGDRQQYVWALLDPDSAIPPADDAIRIESPKAEAGSTVPKSQTRRRKSTVSGTVNNSNGNGHATAPSAASANGQATKANGQARKSLSRKAGQQDISGLIQQAESLRTSLRDALVKTHALLKGLKHHRRATRTLENTLGAIRQLKTLGL